MESRPPLESARTAVARREDRAVELVLDAMLSGDDEALLAALRSSGGRLLPQARQDLLAAALDALPIAVRRTDPATLVLEAMLCRLTLRYDDAIRLSSAAQALVDQGGGDGLEAHILDWLLLMLLWRSRCGWADPHEAVARVRERLGCRHGLSSAHSLDAGESIEWSSWLLGELATVQIATGDLDEAALHLDEMLGNARLLCDDRMLAAALAHRGFLELVDGAFQTAAASARSSLQHAARGGSADLSHIPCAHLVLGWAAVQELDIVTAREHLLAAESKSALQIDPVLSEFTRLLEIKLLAEEGAVQEAGRRLAEHRPSHDSQPAFLQRLSVLTAGQLASVASDTTGLRDQARTLVELGFVDDADLFEALAEASQGQGGTALDRLDDLLARPRLHFSLAAGAASLRVGLLLRAGRSTRAAELLPDLLNRVASQRMILILSIGYLGGAAFTRLLEAEAQRADGHPFAGEALASLGGYSRPFPDLGARKDVGGAGWLLLTPRERDVLTELSLGGSYADVADAMFISENTVKTHLTSAYRKLGVDRRVDALRIARDNHVL
jgi:LuxR family maltose regulon positive regulatory protein